MFELRVFTPESKVFGVYVVRSTVDDFLNIIESKNGIFFKDEKTQKTFVFPDVSKFIFELKEQKL
ncbi:MAG: hypothetical protein IJT04_03615 [Bacteroidales bacterium]|nr:hypothetical protein [Bacteroidales bacterium]